MSSEMSDKLQVWTNDCDYVVAWSAEDAMQIAREFYGSPDDPSDNARFRACDSSAHLKMREEDGTVAADKTIGEWAAENGRGYLGCSER